MVATVHRCNQYKQRVDRQHGSERPGVSARLQRDNNADDRVRARESRPQMARVAVDERHDPGKHAYRYTSVSAFVSGSKRAPTTGRKM